MIKNDKRMRASNKILKEALIRLLKNKDIDQISITELSKESGISRTTFYRNYNSLEDILIKYQIEWYIDISEALASENLDININYYFFKEAEKELEFFRAIVQCRLNYIMMMELKNIIELLVEDRFSQISHKRKDINYNKAYSYLLYAFSGHAHTTILYWLDNPELSAKEINDYFEAYLDNDGLISMLPLYNTE